MYYTPNFVHMAIVTYSQSFVYILSYFVHFTL
nr:MAG TPA: hypothetical protein [Caudoviricetes sp.]